MKLIVASDEKTDLTDKVTKCLEEQKWRWADIGKVAAKKVAGEDADFGIFFCWSGTGICIAANKVKGARAALCWTPDIAHLARKWDDANILCLSLKATDFKTTKAILSSWFKTEFDEEELDQAHKVD
jgi:ribose 5-phosphate isomerase B